MSPSHTRVEYDLTKLSRSLLQPITGLAKWAGNNREKSRARAFGTTRKNQSNLLEEETIGL
jgi:DNA-binding HxlR family transcriptional regulator